MKFDFKLTEDQNRFFQLPHKYKAFVGGFGSGKSETLLVSALVDALSSSKATIALYSPTYDLLKLTLAPRLLLKLDSLGVRYKYNKSDFTISTSTGGIGDFIMRSLDTPERIIGYEVFSSHIDELDTLNKDHAEHCFNQIMARNRQNIKGLPNKIGVYTTPEGFKFVYKRFVTDATKDFGLVQASTISNPFVPDDYVDNLKKTFPPALVEAYVNGQFVNLKSGSVYTCYSITDNDCITELSDHNLELNIGMDFNIGKMAAIIGIKQSNGEVHIIDEIINAFDTAEMVQLISSKYGNVPGRVIKIFPDAAGQQRHSTSGGLTDHQILRNAGFKVYVEGINPSIRDRINMVNAAFLNGANQRRMKINRSKCPKLSAGLIEQAYKNGVPDKSSGVDHANDALGYLTCNLLPFNSNSVSKLLRFK